MKYLNHQPNINPTAVIFEGAIVIGEVTLHENVNVWYNATVRGDMARIEVGKNTNIQDNAVIHTNTDMPTIIGENVTIGHSAIIHAATIKDNALIGMGSIILDGVVVEEGAMVGAGCLVPPGKIVPKRTLVVGNPMRIVRELRDEEVLCNIDNAKHYLKLMSEYHE